jgi:hypothetical protein
VGVGGVTAVKIILLLFKSSLEKRSAKDFLEPDQNSM